MQNRLSALKIRSVCITVYTYVSNPPAFWAGVFFVAQLLQIDLH